MSTTVIDLLENFFNKMNGLKTDKEKYKNGVSAAHNRVTTN